MPSIQIQYEQKDAYACLCYLKSKILRNFNHTSPCDSRKNCSR